MSTETFWKTVIAEVDASPDQAEACLDAAMSACGFRGPAPRYIRFEWLLLIPTHYEWRTEVWAENGGSALSVRFGLATGWAYYLSLTPILVAAIFMPLVMIDHHDWMAPGIIATFALYSLPIAHGIAVRLRSAALEKALWQGLAPLGAWRAGRTIKRTLNYAYGADRVIEHRLPGARP